MIKIRHISNFAGPTDLQQVFISRAEQFAYVSVDERGCEAAVVSAFIPGMTGAFGNLAKVDMILDRSLFM